MAQRSAEPRSQRVATGFIIFGGMILILGGTFQALMGVAGIFSDEFFVTTRSYVFEFDATTWGWIHLVLGLIVVAVGFGVLAGQTWGRVGGVVVAACSALSNFAFLPYYPFWSLLVIALDVCVIWALIAHGRDFVIEAEY